MMSTELRLLAYSVALLFVLVAVQGYCGVRAQGLVVMAGNRDHLKDPTIMQARTKRLVDNMRENMWFFVPLVLIGAAIDVSNSWTVLGARLFFYARVAHAALYLVGVPYVRAAAWFAGIVGCILIFLALFGILQ